MTVKLWAGTLPIRSNRISWKRHINHNIRLMESSPYLLGQIGLVGNSWVNCSAIVDWLSPYLLGQIGLVGNFFIL